MSDAERPINKKRPLYDPINEQLNDHKRAKVAADALKPKFNETPIEFQDPQGRTAGLREIGKRVNPDPRQFEYQGTFTVHIYRERTPFKESYNYVGMTSGANIIADSVAQKALEHLMKSVMYLYGITPPSKIGDKPISERFQDKTSGKQVEASQPKEIENKIK